MARCSKLARANVPVALVAAVLCGAPCAPAGAQESGAGDAEAGEPLVTDRPDFTESAETVARGRVQVEGGYTFTEGDEEHEHSFGEVLVRIGLSTRFELRLGIDSWIRLDPAEPEPGADGFVDPALAAKVVLRVDADDRLLSPQLALLFGTTLPVGSSELRESHAQPFAVLAASWDLSPTVSLGANFGGAIASAAGKQYGELSASVAAGFGVTERLGVFVELFGFLPESDGGPETSYLDAGVTRLLSNDLQLDLRVGVGLDDEADDFFAGIGVSWRH